MQAERLRGIQCRLMVSPVCAHYNSVHLAATQPKKETSPAADEKNDWKRRCSKLLKVCTAKCQWSEQGEYDRAYDYEEKCKRYSFDHISPLSFDKNRASS
jgi:hypothetical protein